MLRLKRRRVTAVIAALVAIAICLFVNPNSYEAIFTKIEDTEAEKPFDSELLATEVLEKLEVKGRAPKTGYSREQFYDGWPMVDDCNLRQRILKRELGDTAVLDGCNVVAGEFDEPYTGEHIVLNSKSDVAKIQIDHVVALSDAW